MYFEDLSNYAYMGRRKTDEINIGWLSADHDYSKGYVPPQAIENLELICKSMASFRRCRGFHVCEFCNKEIGNGEIRVIGDNGTIYASPTMIVHYMEEHEYRPPIEFLQALQNYRYFSIDWDNYENAQKSGFL